MISESSSTVASGTKLDAGTQPSAQTAGRASEAMEALRQEARSLAASVAQLGNSSEAPEPQVPTSADLYREEVA